MGQRTVITSNGIISACLLAIGLACTPRVEASTPALPLPLFNTGVDAAGAALPGGSVDPHYRLITSDDPAFPGPDAIVTTAIAQGYWIPNGPTSKWIAPSGNQDYPNTGPCIANGAYTYRTSFDLTGFEPSTVAIAGRWASDNTGAVLRVNGVDTGFIASSYSSFSDFALSSGFVSGVNTIDFVVTDYGCPTGILVELSGTAAPELGTDTVPDPFAFASRSGVPALTTQISDPVTPVGYDAPATIAITNGEYSIGCTSAFTVAPGTLAPGQSVCVRHNTAEAYFTAVTTTLTIGGVSGTFTTTTVAGPALSISPSILYFAGQAVGTTSAGRVVTVTNTGGAPASLLPAAITGDYAILATSCGPFLGPASSCSITVTFTPLRAGPLAGMLQVLSAAGHPLVSLGGTGLSPDPADIVAIASGDRHSCALTAAGGVKCWGSNEFGQLGDNQASGNRSLVPVDVSGLSSGVAAIAAGGFHSCALTTGGGVQCWGSNEFRQLGNAMIPQSPSLIPVDVSGLSSGVAAISTGVNFTCALTTGGGVKCWGDNYVGQLGDNQASGSLSIVPVTVTGLADGVVALSARGRRACAVTTGGGVKCWGNQNFVPDDVTGLASPIASVTIGEAHTCALTLQGGAKCWGSDLFGQIGSDQPSGPFSYYYVPADVSGLASGVAAISAGGFHTCALSTNGSVKCWGQNYFGGLGDGTTVDRDVPTDIPGLSTGVAAVDAGRYHTCAITTGGRAVCWGSNESGQLGDGTDTNRNVAVTVSGLTGIDVVPTSFSFPSQTGVAIATTRTTAPITPTGYYDPSPVAVTTGEYSIGCTGSFTTSAGIINPGQSVCVRHVASFSYSQAVTTTLTIGGIAASFTSTTAPAPAFSLSPTSIDFGSSPVGTSSVGRTITLSNPGPHEAYGLGLGVAGDFAIVSSTCPSTLPGGASCELTLVFTPVAIGGRADEMLVFSSNAQPSMLRLLLSGTGTFSDTTPSAFSFTDQFLVPTNTVATSAPVQINGLGSATPVTVIGGTYAVSSTNACTGDVQAFTAIPGLVTNGQYVCVRHTTSAVPGGSNDTQLIVGGLGDTFTTVTIDTVPAPFVFAPVVGAARSSLSVSAPAVITGINTAAPVTVAGGEYSIGCTGSFTSAQGSITPGQPVCVRHDAAATPGTTKTTTLTIGGVAGTFASTTALTTADLSISQTASPASASTGKDVMVTLTASNIGAASIAGVTITDLIPAGTTFIWASPGCSHNAGTVTCPVGTLAAGASAQRKVVIRPTVATPITNTVTVAGAEQDVDAANNASNATMPVSTSPAGVAVLRYRLFSPISSEHLYTTDLNEYNVLGAIAGVWIQEGTVGKVLNNPGTLAGVDATPYYRLYNASNAQHHWTTDPNEYYTLILFPQYSAEGVDGYIFPTQAAGTIPLYRLLYPFSVPVAGLHHWTIDANEYNALIASFGWVGEGGSGFVIP